jgi:hypothetical protein
MRHVLEAFIAWLPLDARSRRALALFYCVAWRPSARVLPAFFASMFVESLVAGVLRQIGFVFWPVVFGAFVPISCATVVAGSLVWRGHLQADGAIRRVTGA